MKKHIFFLLVILTCLFSFCPVLAGPEQVELLPLHKWGYYNVGGWGFYALDGEFSWFAIVLHNPTNNAFTVSLPAEADVNHLSRHKIVNTAYKVMPFGNSEFFHDNREKVYFTGDLTLPKHSTYAIYMDITDMQPYSGQWDVPAFLDVRISDQTQTVTKNVEGILARDGYDEVPTQLVIVVPGAPDLQNISFCRDYSAPEKKISFTYTLKNVAHDAIRLELAATLAVEGLDKSIPVSYISCTTGSGKSCMKRIDKTNNSIYINSLETMEFRGEATATRQLTYPYFKIRTSLRYDYNGKTLIPFLIGETTTSCSSVTPVPTETSTPVPTAATLTPAITTTPQIPGTNAVISEGICRDYDRNTGKVTFRYGIRNTTSMVVPVELAMTLAVEGQSGTIAVRNMTCISSGASCTSRIENSYIKLNPMETIQIFGEADLQTIPAKADFYIRTSLRYRNGDDLVPVLIGTTTESCSAAPTPQDPTITTTPVITTTPAPTADTQLRTVTFCKTSDSSGRKVGFVYALRNESGVTIPVELATTMAVEGLQRTVPARYLRCTSDSGSSCDGRIRDGYLTLNPGETAELRGELQLPADPANPNFTIRTSLRYNYNGQKLIPFYVGTTGNICAAAHSAEIQEDMFTTSVTLINEENTDKTLSAGTILLRDKPVTDYIGSAVFGSVDGTTASEQSVIFNNGESLILPPQSVTDIQLSFRVDPESIVVSNDDVKWNYSIADSADKSRSNENDFQSQPIPETGNDTELQFFYVDDGREYNIIPVFPDK